MMNDKPHNDLRDAATACGTQDGTREERETAPPPARRGGAPDGTLPSGAPPCDPPASDAPAARRRGGAPRGNANRLTHGMDSHRLVLGTLTRRKRHDESEAERRARRSLAKVETQAHEFRAALERAVIDASGSISLSAACLIATAARWERHAMLALRWLRERHDAMDDAQRLAYSREIARASAERDKAIKRLSLDREKKQSIYDRYYAPMLAAAQTPTDAATRDVERQDGPQAEQGPGDASNASVGDSGGDNLMPLIPPGF